MERLKIIWNFRWKRTQDKANVCTRIQRYDDVIFSDIKPISKGFWKPFSLPQRRRLSEHELVQTLVSPQQLQSPNQLLTTSPKVKALNEARIRERGGLSFIPVRRRVPSALSGKARAEVRTAVRSQLASSSHAANYVLYSDAFLSLTCN